jgi:hypothetical protein
MKICFKCKIDKDNSEFHKNNRNYDGLCNYCKDCSILDKKDYIARCKNREHITVDNIKCNQCGEIKLISEYTKNINTKTGYNIICKKCKNKIHRVWNIKYKEKNGYTREQKKASEVKEWINLFKTGPCVDCGQSYEPSLMDFDHLKDKHKCISKMVIERTSKENLLAEMEKCELVCCYCHRKRTWDRQNHNCNRTEANKRNMEIMMRAKDVPCEICGKKFEFCNMQFDHINPAEKSYNISALWGASEEKLRTEIVKCRILCTMCHRKISLKEQKEGKYPVRKKIKLYTGDIDQECSRCHQIKLYSAFSIKRGAATGRDRTCKGCQRIIRKNK